MTQDLLASNVEVLLLSVLVGITLLGYMIALNSHGPTRLSFSYLLATLILAGTVWSIVNYVNSGVNRHKSEQFEKLKLAKLQAEERIRSQEQALLETKQKAIYGIKLNKIINLGTGLCSNIMNVDLRDFSVELDVMIGRARKIKIDVRNLQSSYNNLENTIKGYPQSKASIKEALDQLSAAANYYALYFRSEDTAQEELRERVMRQKARKAYEAFKQAREFVTSGT